MTRYEHFWEVCTNERATESASGDCARRGGQELLSRLKELTQLHRKKGKVRIVKSGCLDLCKQGCALGAFSRGPDGQTVETWYAQVQPKDADELFQAHVLDGKPLARLALAVRPRGETFSSEDLPPPQSP